MAKKNSITCIISAKLSQQANRRVVIDGFFVMKTWRNWLGRDKYQILAEEENAADAVRKLNEILGYKE